MHYVTRCDCRNVRGKVRHLPFKMVDAADNSHYQLTVQTGISFAALRSTRTELLTEVGIHSFGATLAATSLPGRCA